MVERNRERWERETPAAWRDSDERGRERPRVRESGEGERNR
jgi:hypothetical protein